MSNVTLDQSVLSELRAATGDEFLTELIETFLTEAPGMISQLEEAAAIGDAAGFRRAAHSIKSNANTFGATALAALAKDMELSGKTDGIDALKAEYEGTANALRAMVNE